MQSWKKWNPAIAASLFVIMVGSLSACTQQDRQLSSAERQSTVRTDADEAVNYQATEESAASGTGADTIKNLRLGQPLSYYSNEFSRMGYHIVNVSEVDDRHVYDLRRGTERYLVSLDSAEDQDQVSGINVQQFRAITTEGIGAGTQTGQRQATTTTATKQTTASRAMTGQTTAEQTEKDRAVQATVKEIQRLQPGKKAHEYIPEIARQGTVTEYERGERSAEVEFRGRDGNHYQVNMTIDPQRDTVSKIEVDESVWSAL